MMLKTVSEDFFITRLTLFLIDWILFDGALFMNVEVM